MRITKLRVASSYMIFCAIIMIFAHIVIPHSHNTCYDSQNEQSNACCNQELSEQSNHDGTHHNCMIKNIVYQQDSQKDGDLHLIALSVEHFGHTYSPRIPILETGVNFRIPLSNTIIQRYIFKKLPQRAPPTTV